MFSGRKGGRPHIRICTLFVSEGTEPPPRNGAVVQTAMERIYAQGLWVVFREGRSPSLRIVQFHVGWHSVAARVPVVQDQHGTGHIPKDSGLCLAGGTEPSHT